MRMEPGTLEALIEDAAARGAAKAVQSQLRHHEAPADGVLLVTPKEAGRRLGGLSESYVRDVLMARGEVEVIHGVGRGLKVTVRSLARLVDRRLEDVRRRG